MKPLEIKLRTEFCHALLARRGEISNVQFRILFMFGITRFTIETPRSPDNLDDLLCYPVPCEQSYHRGPFRPVHRGRGMVLDPAQAFSPSRKVAGLDALFYLEIDGS